MTARPTQQHTTDDRALGSVLRAESGGGSAGRQDDDGTSILLDRGRDSGQSQGLGGVGRSGGQLSQLVEERRVADGRLGEERGLGHHADSLQGVRTLGGLSGKHDAVGTVEDGVGDVRNLGSGRSRVVLEIECARQPACCDIPAVVPDLRGRERWVRYSRSSTPTSGWHR